MLWSRELDRTGTVFLEVAQPGERSFFELNTMFHILVMMPDSGASISLSEKQFDRIKAQSKYL